MPRNCINVDLTYFKHVITQILMKLKLVIVTISNYKAIYS